MCYVLMHFVGNSKSNGGRESAEKEKDRYCVGGEWKGGREGRSEYLFTHAHICSPQESDAGKDKEKKKETSRVRTPTITCAFYPHVHFYMYLHSPFLSSPSSPLLPLLPSLLSFLPPFPSVLLLSEDERSHVPL